MQPTVKIIQQDKNWSSKSRVRVNDVVQYRNCYFQNTSGKNSEPSVYGNQDWIFLCEAMPFYKGLKIIKSVNNFGKGLQINDFVSGQRSVGNYWRLAVYNGGDPEEDSSFTVDSGIPNLQTVLFQGDRQIQNPQWSFLSDLGGTTAFIDIEQFIGTQRPTFFHVIEQPQSEDLIQNCYLNIPPVEALEKNIVWKYMNNTFRDISIVPTESLIGISTIIGFGGLGDYPVLKQGSVAEIRLVKKTTMGGEPERFYYEYSVTFQDFLRAEPYVDYNGYYRSLLSYSRVVDPETSEIISKECSSLIQRNDGAAEGEFTITFEAEDNHILITMFSPENILKYNWNVQATYGNLFGNDREVKYEYEAVDVGSGIGALNTLKIRVYIASVEETGFSYLPFSFDYHSLLI